MESVQTVQKIKQKTVHRHGDSGEGFRGSGLQYCEQKDVDIGGGENV